MQQMFPQAILLMKKRSFIVPLSGNLRPELDFVRYGEHFWGYDAHEDDTTHFLKELNVVI